MTVLPVAALGEEAQVPRSSGAAARLRTLVQAKASYALADQVVYSFGNMMVAALMARHTGARTFGMYILTQRALDVWLQLCNVCLWGPVSFRLAGVEGERRRRYLGSQFVGQLALCVLGVAAFFAATRWSATPARGLYYGVFAPLILASATIVFREFTRRMYFAEMRFREAFWTDVATVALQIGGVVWLLATGRLTLPGALSMLACGAGVVSLWWLLREWSRLAFRARDCVRDLRANLQLGRWFLGSNMVFMASSQCNPWLLGTLLGGPAVAGYAVCESMVNIPRVALNSLQNMMAPTMAQALNAGGRSALVHVIRGYDRALLAGSAIFAVAIVFCGPIVTRLIFKSVPGNARTLLLLLALNFVAFAATLAQSYGLSALHRANLPFYANAAGLAVQAALSVVLVHRFGVPGAAGAMLLGSVAVLLVRGVFFHREANRA